MLAGVAFAQPTTNTALNHTGVDQLSGAGTSIEIKPVSGNNWEFFYVPSNITTKPGELRPRAERGLDPHKGGANIQGSNITDGKKVIVLTGQCDINSCNETTIMQILNYDSSNPDPSLPYVMVKGNKRVGTNQWELTVSGAPPVTINDSLFNFELRTNNKQVRLIVFQGGTQVYNQVWNITQNRGGITRFRFGAYHKNSEFPKVEGSVRFRGTKSNSFIVPANTGV